MRTARLILRGSKEPQKGEVSREKSRPHSQGVRVTEHLFARHTLQGSIRHMPRPGGQRQTGRISDCQHPALSSGHLGSPGRSFIFPSSLSQEAGGVLPPGLNLHSHSRPMLLPYFYLLKSSSRRMPKNSALNRMGFYFSLM